MSRTWRWTRHYFQPRWSGRSSSGSSGCGVADSRSSGWPCQWLGKTENFTMYRQTSGHLGVKLPPTHLCFGSLSLRRMRITFPPLSSLWTSFRFQRAYLGQRTRKRHFITLSRVFVIEINDADTSRDGPEVHFFLFFFIFCVKARELAQVAKLRLNSPDLSRNCIIYCKLRNCLKYNIFELLMRKRFSCGILINCFILVLFLQSTISVKFSAIVVTKGTLYIF